MSDKVLKLWVVTVHHFSSLLTYSFEKEGYSRKHVRSQLDDYGLRRVTISPKNETNAKRLREYHEKQREADRLATAIGDSIRGYLAGDTTNIGRMIDFLQELDKQAITISDLIYYCRHNVLYVARLLRRNQS